MESRRCPRANPGPHCSPASSGPRRVMTSRIRVTRSGRDRSAVRPKDSANSAHGVHGARGAELIFPLEDFLVDFEHAPGPDLQVKLVADEILVGLTALPPLVRRPMQDGADGLGQRPAVARQREHRPATAMREGQRGDVAEHDGKAVGHRLADGVGEPFAPAGRQEDGGGLVEVGHVLLRRQEAKPGERSLGGAHRGVPPEFLRAHDPQGDLISFRGQSARHVEGQVDALDQRLVTEQQQELPAILQAQRREHLGPRPAGRGGALQVDAVADHAQGGRGNAGARRPSATGSATAIMRTAEPM